VSPFTSQWDDLKKETVLTVEGGRAEQGLRTGVSVDSERPEYFLVDTVAMVAASTRFLCTVPPGKMRIWASAQIGCPKSAF